MSKYDLWKKLGHRWKLLRSNGQLYMDRLPVVGRGFMFIYGEGAMFIKTSQVQHSEGLAKQHGWEFRTLNSTYRLLKV